MCGIVGAVADRDAVPLLIDGLKRLEYRGYDSAGIAINSSDTGIQRLRTAGKVKSLEALVARSALKGTTGIAHTRWATHGPPSEANAHPHMFNDELALVHNGIIENYAELAEKQRADGHKHSSETDTEILVHEIGHHLQAADDLLAAVRSAAESLEGSYAMAVMQKGHPERIVAARRGSPLVVGIGHDGHYLASDITALLPVTQRFVVLEEGDFAELTRSELKIVDRAGKTVTRQPRTVQLSADAIDKGQYRHYMLKEIHEQPHAVSNTLTGRLANGRVVTRSFGIDDSIVSNVDGVHFVACGTSYHAALVGKHWMESFARIPCCADIASEFRYRRPVYRPNTLVVVISQSGETADTLAALREAKVIGFERFVSICNVPESSLARESELNVMTRAGPEIGVASTKAFTTQLTAILLLTIALARGKGLSAQEEARIVEDLNRLPQKMDRVLAQVASPVRSTAIALAKKSNALFLGRGAMYPIAMEGALKLKEISYIHAEAYPAGELKHGPLALVDEQMPVVTVAPNDELLEKLKANMEEVQARGGKLFVFADVADHLKSGNGLEVISMPPSHELLAPILYTLPLQLLAYEVAVLKGTDIDQPRNLAKSVTVE